MSCSDIAQELNVSASFVQNKVKNIGIQRTSEDIMELKASKQRYDLDMVKLRELYQSGESSYKIAEIFGVSSSLIGKRIREMNIQRTHSEAQRNRFDV